MECFFFQEYQIGVCEAEIKSNIFKPISVETNGDMGFLNDSIDKKFIAAKAGSVQERILINIANNCSFNGNLQKLKKSFIEITLQLCPKRVK